MQAGDITKLKSFLKQHLPAQNLAQSKGYTIPLQIVTLEHATFCHMHRAPQGGINLLGN